MFCYHNRLVEARLGRLAELFPIVVVVGARQVGKSTLLQHLLGTGVKRFVFDPVDDLYGARSDPDLFLDQHEPPLLLDEIQYAVELLPPLKRRVDRNPGKKGLYFLTGSQNLAVLKDVAESMAGRAGILELQAMTLLEWERVASPPDHESWLSRWLLEPERFAQEPPQRLGPSIPLGQRLWHWQPPFNPPRSSASRPSSRPPP